MRKVTNLFIALMAVGVMVSCTRKKAFDMLVQEYRFHTDLVQVSDTVIDALLASTKSDDHHSAIVIDLRPKDAGFEVEFGDQCVGDGFLKVVVVEYELVFPVHPITP